MDIVISKNKKRLDFEVHPKVWTKNFGVHFNCRAFLLYCQLFLHIPLKQISPY